MKTTAKTHPRGAGQQYRGRHFNEEVDETSTTTILQAKSHESLDFHFAIPPPRRRERGEWGFTLYSSSAGSKAKTEYDHGGTHD
eukprot:4230566-Pyramimonas_sp.AAC.1